MWSRLLLNPLPVLFSLALPRAISRFFDMSIWWRDTTSYNSGVYVLAWTKQWYEKKTISYHLQQSKLRNKNCANPGCFQCENLPNDALSCLRCLTFLSFTVIIFLSENEIGIANDFLGSSRKISTWNNVSFCVNIRNTSCDVSFFAKEAVAKYEFSVSLASSPTFEETVTFRPEFDSKLLFLVKCSLLWNILSWFADILNKITTRTLQN